mgnify:FL=1|jgi:hypothetical protein|nr:MAG TPA: hypothetical protein [Caudoviricetes sp.]
MAKWYGVIGYAETVETTPGVWKEQVTKRNYYGDLTRNTRRLQTADKLNDDINISNELSIVADPYAMNNFHSMRYAEFMGTAWKITNVEVQYPRLILTLGGVWNG